MFVICPLKSPTDENPHEKDMTANLQGRYAATQNTNVSKKWSIFIILPVIHLVYIINLWPITTSLKSYDGLLDLEEFGHDMSWKKKKSPPLCALKTFSTVTQTPFLIPY